MPRDRIRRSRSRRRCHFFRRTADIYFGLPTQARRLQREGVDLSTVTTWQAWRTDLSGAGREELATTKFPDCRCETGTCEETCPYGEFWAPESGVENFFLMTQFVPGQSEPEYKSSTRYQEARRKMDGDTTARAIATRAGRGVGRADNCRGDSRYRLLRLVESE